MTSANSCQIQRHRAELFMGIEVRLRPGFEKGDRPVAGEVVQSPQCASDNAFFFIPGRTLRQHRLTGTCQKEGIEQSDVVLMSEKIGVMRAISGEQVAQREPNDG